MTPISLLSYCGDHRVIQKSFFFGRRLLIRQSSISSQLPRLLGVSNGRGGRSLDWSPTTQTSDRNVSSTSAGANVGIGPNPGLASVISQGISRLEASAADIRARTKPKRRKKDGSQTPRQQMEAQRVLDTATECLDSLVERGVSNLHVRGEPILLLEVQVNADLKLAKLYWTLPYSILLHDEITNAMFRTLMKKMHDRVEHGGAKLLQRQVHSQLRSYYPPRIRMIPATNEMLQKAILDVS